MTATASRRATPPGNADTSSGDGGPRGAAARRPVLILLIGAAVLVLVAVWVVAFSPALGARTVTVTGNHALTADQVRAAAGVSRGAPLIRLDTAAVRRRVEALPDVASAEVTIDYPSTVRIHVLERVPVGYIANVSVGGSSFVLVDQAGAQYREVASAPANLPQFALPTGAGATATGRAVAVVAASLSSAVLAQLAQVSADSPESITLVLRDGRIVSWGSDERSQQKAALLPALLTQPGTRFDISNPALVVVR